MSLPTAVARPLLVASFVKGGVAGVQHPEPFVGMAQEADVPAGPAVVRATSATMAVAGTTLALGIRPRASAVALAGCLVGLSYVVHGFWREDDPQARLEHQNAFLGNVGILGGLLLVAADAG
ncbi:DoxX family protein [Patulibacter sp. S7RM1-6]